MIKILNKIENTRRLYKEKGERRLYKADKPQSVFYKVKWTEDQFLIVNYSLLFLFLFLTLPPLVL